MSLTLSLRAEVLKTKRTSAFYLTVFASSIVTLMELLEMLTTSESVQRLNGDPWQKYFDLTLQMMDFMIVPLYIILISTLLAQIEYRNNTWKQVLSSPQTEAAIFISKFVNLQLLIITFLILNTVFLILGALLLNIFYPGLHLLGHYLDWLKLGEILLKTYICSLAISAFQYWLSLRIRNFIVPLAIGFVLWLAGGMLVFEYRSVFKEWYPYSYLMMIILPKHKDLTPVLEWRAIGVASVLLTGGFLDFKYRRRKG